MNNVLKNSLFVSQNKKFDEIQSIVRQFSAEYVGNSIIKDNIFADIQNYARKKEIALEMLYASPDGYYKVVLMDVMMPVMNGYEASMKIREMKSNKSSIPIVAMTANAFEEDKEQALKSGMDYFVSKPFDIKSLLSLLSEILAK